MDAINNTLVQPSPQPAVQLVIAQNEVATQSGVAQDEAIQTEVSAQNVVQTDATQPVHEARKRSGGRLAKLKRTATSVRPGCAPLTVVSVEPAKEKKLVFLIPSEHENGNIEEFTHIHDVATQFAAFSQIGAVTQIAIHDKKWEMALVLTNTNCADDEAMLSNAFATLMATIDASAELRNGFRRGTSSTWEFRVGTKVLDEGNF